MAGGVVFLPRTEGKPLFPRYAEAALALGLQVFAVWDAHAIEIRTAAPPYELQARLPMGNQATPAEFRAILTSLLERLKPLAITGAVERNNFV